MMKVTKPVAFDKGDGKKLFILNKWNENEKNLKKRCIDV